MSSDRLKNILRSEVNSAWDGLSKFVKDFDSYLEDIEKQYEETGKFKHESKYDPGNPNHQFSQSDAGQGHKTYGYEQNNFKDSPSSMSTEDQYYAALELKKPATFDQVKKAYRTLKIGRAHV